MTVARSLIVACGGFFVLGAATGGLLFSGHGRNQTGNIVSMENTQTKSIADAVHASARTEARTDTIRPAETVRVVTRRILVSAGRCGETREVTRTTGAVVDRVVYRTAASDRVASSSEAAMQTKTIVTAAPRPRWLAGVGYSPPVLGGPGASVTAGLRVAGPLWLAVTATTRRQVTVGAIVTW